MKKSLLIIAILSMLLVGCKNTTTTTTTKTTTVDEAAILAKSKLHKTLVTYENAPVLEDGIYVFDTLAWLSHLNVIRDGERITIENSKARGGYDMHYQKYHFYNVYNYANARVLANSEIGYLYRNTIGNLEEAQRKTLELIDYLENFDYYIIDYYFMDFIDVIILADDGIYKIWMNKTKIYIIQKLNRIEPLPE